MVKERTEEAKSVPALSSAVALTSDVLERVLPQGSRLQDRLDDLRETLGQQQPESHLESSKEQLIAVIDSAEILLETPKARAQENQIAAWPSTPEHANLDRDVSAIVTTRYFHSWPFYTVTAILLAGLSVWGINVTGSYEGLTEAQRKLEVADRAVDVAKEELVQNRGLFASELKRGKEALKENKKEIDKTKSDVLASFETDMEAIKKGIEGGIGSPKQIRQDIENKFLNEIRDVSKTETEGLLQSLKDDIDAERRKAIYSLAQERGTSPATLAGLVRQELVSIKAMDEAIKNRMLIKFGKILGTPVASLEDFFIQRVGQIETQLQEEAMGAKRLAFEGLSNDPDNPVAGFDDLAMREIEAVQATAGRAKGALEAIEKLYGLDLGAVEKKIAETPAQIEAIDIRFEDLQKQVAVIEDRAETMSADLETLANLRQPLTAISEHLDSPYRRAQIDIATVLGNTRWLVLASLLLSLFAIVVAFIAIKCWWSELRKVADAKRPNEPAAVNSTS